MQEATEEIVKLLTPELQKLVAFGKTKVLMKDSAKVGLE